MKSYDHLNFSRASVVHCRASRYIMGLVHTPESKVMAVWICRECLCSISSVSTYYAPKSDIQMKRYDYLNFSRCFAVHCRASRYIMGLIHTSESNVMAVWICWELLCSILRGSIVQFRVSWYIRESIIHRAKCCGCLNLPSIFVFNFECLIFYATESDIQVKSYDHLSSRELLVFIVERPDIWWASHIHPSKKLSSFEFADNFCVQFRPSLYIMRLNRTFEWKVMNIWISQ